MIAEARRRPTTWVLAALFVAAALVRFRALDFGLPHTQARPDETVIIEAARSLLSGRLPNFFDYPWLFIWLTTLAYLGYFVWGLLTGSFQTLAEMVASWPAHWEPFFLMTRAISAAFGTVSVLIIYRLGRQLRDEATGLVAALFLTVVFIHARDSHFGTTDVAMTFFILCGVSLIVDAHRSGRWQTAGLAGFLSGLAAATKYNAVILVVPMIASYALTIATAGGSRRSAMLDRRLPAFAVGFGAAFAIGVPFVLLDRERFLLAMGELIHSMKVGDPRLNLTNGWLHHVEYSLRYGVGWPLLLLGSLGAALLLWTSPIVGTIVLAFPIAYYGVAGSIRNLFFRYTLPIVPFLCLTTAFLVSYTIGEFLRRRSPRQEPARPVTALAIAVVSLAIAAPSALTIWSFDRVMAQTDNRVVVAQWFADNVPPGSSVLQSGGRYGLAQFERRLGYKEWRWDGGRGVFLLDGRPAADRPDWILVQDSPLPSSTQPIVTEFLKEDYVPVTEFKALTIADSLVYDRQDAFYVPFNGFDLVVRPGPNFSLFKRAGAATNRDARASGD